MKKLILLMGIIPFMSFAQSPDFHSLGTIPAATVDQHLASIGYTHQPEMDYNGLFVYAAPKCEMQIGVTDSVYFAIFYTTDKKLAGQVMKENSKMSVPATMDDGRKGRTVKFADCSYFISMSKMKDGEYSYEVMVAYYRNVPEAEVFEE